MDRQQALALLELSSDATAEQIEQRFDLLVRRYRHVTDQLTVEEMNATTAAYEFLKAAERPAPSVKPVSSKKLFGRTQADWANRWHYDKWIWMGLAAAVAFVIYIIFTIATHKTADFKVVVIGDFKLLNQEISTDDVTHSVQQSVIDSLAPTYPEVDQVDFEWIPISFNQNGTLAPAQDSLTQQNMLIKVVARIGTDDLDVLIFDQGAYTNYAAQAQFADLAPLVQRLKETLPAEQFAKIGRLNTVPEGEAESVSGLDLTGLNGINDFKLQGESTIVTVGPRCRNVDWAIEWLYVWISNSTK